MNCGLLQSWAGARYLEQIATIISGMINITDDPKGETYKALLKFAVAHCQSFSLVWRYKMRLKPAEDEMFAALAPFLISERDTKKWPGTELLSGKATIRHYKVAPQVLPVLYRADSLYSWQHPKLPEDLAFYLPNGENWLASVAHEKMAWVADSKLSVETLLKAVPGLQVK